MTTAPHRELSARIDSRVQAGFDGPFECLPPQSPDVPKAARAADARATHIGGGRAAR
ncbi:hypothetical protein ACISU4_35340 [Streptomyces wuyuanensis]|uniref:hypothetical protein n=1 Tax=Streptomyces wuyuanensis TaxID=1196353 RepID=UPI00380710D7